MRCLPIIIAASFICPLGNSIKNSRKYLVKTGRGGGLEGNGGQGTRNRALDIKNESIKPKITPKNKSSAPTLDIKNKIIKPKTLNKSLVPNSPSVVNPDTTPESGGSMFESETDEEEPKDKDKGKRLPGAHFKLSKNVCLFYLALHFQVKTTRRRRNRPSILEKK